MREASVTRRGGAAILIARLTCLLLHEGMARAVSPHTDELFIGSACGTGVLPPPYEGATLVYDKCIPSP